MDPGLTTTKLVFNMNTNAVCTHSIGRSSECHNNASDYVGDPATGPPIIQSLVTLPCLIDVISLSWVNRVELREKDEKSYGRVLGYVFVSSACKYFK